MKLAGIIAEYNPFHNGHAYHIAETRRLTGCDYVVVVMSGNFTERGLPAVIDRHTRAEYACLGGADLVIELPLSYAVSSAETFAAGGVRVLTEIGAEWISFGAENPFAAENTFFPADLASPNRPEASRNAGRNIHNSTHVESAFCEDTAVPMEPMNRLADLLTAEPAEYRRELKTALANGLSYPVARRRAVSEIDPSLAPLLDTPNNILAIEYLKAIRKQQSPLRPVGILRNGAGYHDTELSGFASASGIRKAFSEYVNYAVSDAEYDNIVFHAPSSRTEGMNPAFSENAVSELTGALPPNLRENYLGFLSAIQNHRGHLPSADDYSDFLYLRLKELQENNYSDLSDELFNRIRKLSAGCETFSEIAAAVKNKSVTRSHIDRALLAITLGLTKDYTDAWENALPYLTVLSCRNDAKTLLGEICRNSQVPFLVRTAKDSASLPESAKRLYAAETAANELYRRAYKKATGIALACDSGRKFTTVS